MDKWAKLHWRKNFVNFAVGILNRLMPELKPSYPQTEIIEHVFQQMNNVYETEVIAGRFDDVPFQTIADLKDRNFQRLLQLSRKLLVYFSEDDRYYRQWLGLAMLLVRKEVSKFLETLSLEEFLALVFAQWHFDLRGAIPEEHFSAHKEDFLNMVLANFLMNLVKPE
ncbi:MAG: hypothetical protein ABSD73_08180 [Candidatus Bathyarchaeia archaeon]